MWDLLVTVGNIIVIPALVTMVLDKKLYVPRISSAMSLVGLGFVMVGLVGGGFILSPIVLGVITLMWLFIFLFRATPIAHQTDVVPELGTEIHHSPNATASPSLTRDP
jgi:fatty acid desaturase